LAPLPCSYSRSLKNPALQLLQKSSKSASTTLQRPIWNTFGTVAVRDFSENGCSFIVRRCTLRLDTPSFRASRGPERGSVQSQCTHSCAVRAGRTNRTHLRRWWQQPHPHIGARTRLSGSHSHSQPGDCSTPLSTVKRGILSTTCTKYALRIDSEASMVRVPKMRHARFLED